MLTYCLESSCCWGLLYGFYALFLRHEKSFVYNRAHLLLALFLGLLAPLLSLENQVVGVLLAPVDLSAMAAPALESWAQVTAGQLNWNVFTMVYSLGVALFAGRFLWGLSQIYKIYKQGTVERHATYQLVVMKEAYPPFSFGHCLFVPSSLTKDPQAYDCIITHEAAHIQQAHSIDILVVELLQIIFWFNPILILYKMALRDQHEYLADQAVLCNTSVAQYGHLLLDQSVNTVLPLVHPFFHSSLKKRIMMMTTNSARFSWNKYAFSLLACVLMFWMIACQKSRSITVESKPDVFPYLSSCENEDKEAQKKCSDQNLLTYIYGSVKYPESAKSAGVEGMAVLDFVIKKDGTIGDIKVIRSTNNEALDTEALRVVEQLKAKGGIWTPGQKNGKEVAVSYKLPLRFKLQ